MTGTYPDIPAARMAYDRDGTQMYKISGSSVITARPGSDLTAWNGEALASGFSFGSGGSGYEVIVFPELRDLKAISIGYINSGITSMETSANTTNGLDGTWSALTVPPMAPLTRDAMRNNISARVANGIKAVRFGLTSGLSVFGVYFMHLYGITTAGQNPNRLEFWHPTLDQPLSDTPAFLDWGDRPRATSVIKQVRVKNRSALLTANSITVGREALTDASPTVVSQQGISLDGSTYSSSVVLPGSLAPGAISPVVSIRLTSLSTTVLGLWTQRFTAVAGTWT